jgi:hypothetical protein
LKQAIANNLQLEEANNQLRKRVAVLENETFYFEDLKLKYTNLVKRSSEHEKLLMLVVFLMAEIESLRGRMHTFSFQVDELELSSARDIALPATPNIDAIKGDSQGSPLEGSDEGDYIARYFKTLP